MLPTGGGKSACFQIPGIVGNKTTLVVSPLIALQEDQVTKLRERGISAFALHSGLTETQRRAIDVFYRRPPDKRPPSFLYVSPEHLATEGFLKGFADVRFDTMAVDEAHCISTWGSAFRPDYLRIWETKHALDIPQVMAFTGTSDAKVERDIRIHLGLNDTCTRVRESPIRDNLHISVEDPTRFGRSSEEKVRAKLHRLLYLLGGEYSGPAIVYFSSRSEAAKIFESFKKKKEFLQRTGYTPYLFHAKLPQSDKDQALQGFTNDTKPIVFATTAFGMGIDRSDVRQVVHYNSPFTLIDYAQQIGRGGRDGQNALCTTFHSPIDYFQKEIPKVHREVPSYDFVRRVLKNIYTQYKKLDSSQQATFSTKRYLDVVRMLVKKNLVVRDMSLYMHRLSYSVDILKRLGLIDEGPSFKVSLCKPGSRKDQQIIQKTEMQERMLLREKKRVERFFEDTHPTQERLWEILEEI